MNKLTSSATFNEAMTLLPRIHDIIMNPPILDKYVIPDTYYSDYYKILLNKKYPLVRPTIKLAKEGKIKLFSTSYTSDKLLRKEELVMPSYFTSFQFGTKNGDIVSYVNATKKLGLRIDKKTGEPDGTMTGNENDIYNYLQCGATGYIVAKYSNDLSNNVKFVNVCTEMYEELISLAIDSISGINGKTDSYNILKFLIGMYFLQVLIGKSADKAVSIALSLKITNPAIINTECRCLLDGYLEMKSTDDFIKAINHEFSKFVKPGDITLRSITMAMNNRYGQSAMFAFDHFLSFLNLVQQEYLMSGIYKDLNVKKYVAPTLIQSVNQILLVTYGD